MALIRPFRAVRPAQDRVQAVAAVPYDVVNREEAARLASENPLSFLHVSRSEIDLDPSVDPYSEAVYQRARENYQRLLTDSVLIQDPQACLYVYRLVMGGRAQVGVAATFSVEEYDRDLIKKHEKTRKDKEDDRTRHIVTLKAQTGPVFLTFRPQPEVARLLQQAIGGEALYDFTAPDGIRHTLWRVTDADPWTRAFAQIPCLYIADGHHRAASASRARAELGAENPGAGFFLAVAFPSDQLRILPYNRVVRDLNGQTPEQLRDALAGKVPIRNGARPEPAGPGRCAMYLNRSWYEIDLSGLRAEAPSERLDVARLQSHVLEPLLGVGDPRTDKRIDFVGGIRGTQELVRLVDSGQAAVAFSMHPTSLDELMAISDAGEIMPPKSTWFEPKLRDAIVIHSIQGEP
ncbi:MAG: DUF1015 family protein [Candidatus Eremiobacterota bacterium]